MTTYIFAPKSKNKPALILQRPVDESVSLSICFYFSMPKINVCLVLVLATRPVLSAKTRCLREMIIPKFGESVQSYAFRREVLREGSRMKA